ncbi:C4-dicarboxylate ABC transporter substrate-binding protein [Aliihoeflea sp. 2WW]|uniref:C4-dicarboxylate ABC transporter substrate-binding protein n=1 Tax=Aliihoeflea sp. 2WW TaxID=1381123 RepID=UPI0004670126|nr:C4-dicarboxylate ABC transporter substrate-binding protein [Aliihoeflea sp. 2WW]
MTKLAKLAVLASATLLSGAALAQTNLMISASLPQVHFWVGQHMDPFADAIEAETNGEIAFTRFYAGELTSVGRELDALQGGTVAVAAPLLAPYHEGTFPLSDVTQLPTIGTNSELMTRAFLKLMDDDTELADGKTFYQYEIEPKEIRAWPVATTAAYAISFAGENPDSVSGLSGKPMRAGSALHTIFLNELGVTPVTMPSSASYEALSRGTVEGTILSIGDWRSYSLQDVLTHTITGVAVGHWGSYLAINNATWETLTPEQQETWDRVARDIAMQNAAGIDAQDIEVQEEAAGAGSVFTPITDMSQEMQDHIAMASTNTWQTWVEQTEAAGHPGRATAKRWAELVVEEGGELPAGVAEFLEL